MRPTTVYIFQWTGWDVPIGVHPFTCETLERLVAERALVVWSNRGIYGALSQEHLSIALDAWRDYHQSRAFAVDHTRVTPRFAWDQVVPIDNRLGRLLEQGQSPLEQHAPSDSCTEDEADQRKP